MIEPIKYITDIRGMFRMTGRVVERRIEDLESDRDQWVEDFAKINGSDLEDTNVWDAIASDWAVAFPDESTELVALQDFQSEAESYAEWRFRDTEFIAEREFTDFAKDYADQVRELDTSDWPYNCIDWERAAADLKDDYNAADLDGYTFLFK